MTALKRGFPLVVATAIISTLGWAAGTGKWNRAEAERFFKKMGYAAKPISPDQIETYVDAPATYFLGEQATFLFGRRAPRRVPSPQLDPQDCLITVTAPDGQAVKKPVSGGCSDCIVYDTEASGQRDSLNDVVGALALSLGTYTVSFQCDGKKSSRSITLVANPALNDVSYDILLPQDINSGRGNMTIHLVITNRGATPLSFVTPDSSYASRLVGYWYSPSTHRMRALSSWTGGPAFPIRNASLRDLAITTLAPGKSLSLVSILQAEAPMETRLPMAIPTWDDAEIVAGGILPVLLPDASGKLSTVRPVDFLMRVKHCLSSGPCNPGYDHWSATDSME